MYKEKIKHYDIHHKTYMKRKETAKGINLGQLHSDIVLNISDRSMVRILEPDTSAGDRSSADAPEIHKKASGHLQICARVLL
jgi:hypothetical protein